MHRPLRGGTQFGSQTFQVVLGIHVVPEWQKGDPQVRLAGPLQRLGQDPFCAHGHSLEKLRMERLHPNQVITAVGAGPQHQLGSRQPLERPPKVGEGQGRAVGADGYHSLVAQGEKLLAGPAQPLAETIPPLGHQLKG